MPAARSNAARRVACSRARRIPTRAACSLPNPTMTARGARLFALARAHAGPARPARTCSGCRFAPRCPIVEADCLTTRRRRTARSDRRASQPACMPTHARIAASDRCRRRRRLAAGAPSSTSTALSKRFALGWTVRRAELGRCVMSDFALGAERIRRPGRRERQRQEHAGAADHGAGTCLRRAGSCWAVATSRAPRPPMRATACTGRRWCSRTRNRRSIRAAASASIVTQALEAGRRTLGREARMERARELLAEIGLAAGRCWSAFRRSSPAGSASASTSRVRFAPCRASWSPTRSCPASTCRCRRSC